MKKKKHSATLICTPWLVLTSWKAPILLWEMPMTELPLTALLWDRRLSITEAVFINICIEKRAWRHRKMSATAGQTARWTKLFFKKSTDGLLPQTHYSTALLSLTELPNVLPESFFFPFFFLHTKPAVFCLIHHRCRKQGAPFFSAAAFYVFENYYHVSASFSLPQIAQNQLVQSFIAGHVF